MSRGWPATVCAVLVLALAAPGNAQLPNAAASARLQVLTFTDTSSVRIDVQAPAARLRAGTIVKATIRGPRESAPLWTGTIGRLEVEGDGLARLSHRVAELRPRLWSPQEPNLYHLVIEAGALRDSVRFGFRSVEDRDGRILLNGRPVFLRGNAINPPDRTLPDSLSENRRFAEEYIRYLKSIGINAIRTSRESQVWFDVCDELGMMLVQGRYGAPPGGTNSRPPAGTIADAVRAYRDDVLAPLANHPSVVVYILSNELASADIPILRNGAEAMAAFMDSVYPALRRWDGTRLYIGNAGYGLGRGGDIDDLHRYWGWYYNTFLSYLTLRPPDLYWRSPRRQAFTITEAIGTYTGVDGRINLVSRSKQPDLQLQWTGHAPDTEQAARALRYQAFLAKQGIEMTRRLRVHNPHLAGILPFTILFYRWYEIDGVEDMGTKPVAEQFRTSYSPVLLSWELWMPQVYAGATVRPIAHVVNDAEDGSAIIGAVLRWSLRAADGRVVHEASTRVPDVAYFGTARLPLQLPLPDTLAAGNYTLEGSLVRGDEVLAQNRERILVAQASLPEARLERTVQLYDVDGATAAALARARIPFRRVRSLERLAAKRDLLVLGAGSGDSVITRAKGALRRFVEAGGRALVLSPDAQRFDGSWLPARVTFRTAPMDHEHIYPGGRPHRDGMSVNPERPQHPVFDGIDRDRLFLWSDHTGWDETQPGFPAVYPVTQGFTLDSASALAHTAVLANYDLGLQGVALAELFGGRGSVLLSGFGIVERAGIDPVADRMLRNLVHYQAAADGHHATPLVDAKITWGDYASERGLLTGIYSGLLVNTVPRVPAGLAAAYPLRIDSLGYQVAGRGAGWNSHPGIQHVARGRRPFGPFTFDLGGWVRPTAPAARGEGSVWLRVPLGRTGMITRAWNPSAEPLELEIVLNGAAQRTVVPAGETLDVHTSLDGRTDLALTFRGDRRLVLLETDFR